MKIKLIAILFLAISAVVLVGYVSYIGLSNLMTTLEETVQPDFREEKLQKLLYHVSEAENSIRIYTITKESRYLKSYFSNNHDADSLIQFLIARSLNDPVLIDEFDSIESLLAKKTAIQNRLIRLKQDQRKIDVYEEVLTKIQTIERKNAVFDSLERAIGEAEKNLDLEIQAKEKELLLTESEEEKPGLLKRIFGPGKKANKEQLAQQQFIELKEKELDTLVAAKDTLLIVKNDTLQKENISKNVEQSFEEIKVREEKINRDLTIAELILTKRDKDVSLSIQQQVRLIQTYFNQQDVNQAEKASFFFSKITDLIKVIGSISSMVFLVLVFVIFNDIKVNQRNRKRLERAKKKAEDLAQAKNDFLSNMSHEIRTPMNAILGFAEQLNDSPLDETGKKQLGIIQSASHHLLSIINDILDFAKIEAGKIKLEKIPFYVPDNARIVFDTLYKNAIDKNLKFELEIGDHIKDHYVKGDPVRFRQILFNLAGNAIKFTDNGSVKINIDHDFRHIIIQVIDTGIGIEKENLHLIFNKFDQANQNTSIKYGGTGLGLAIVKKLVEMQKGLITVDSQKDRGTEFTIKIPYIPVDPEILEAQNITSTVTSMTFDTGKNHVLLVDDEEYNLLLLESILKKYKVPFKSAKSGEEAIELFQQNIFQIALIDLQMNQMNGIETMEELRKRFKTNIPIIASTASATDETRKKCLEAGMDDVLIKPILEKDLIQLLNKFLPDKSDIINNGILTNGDLPEEKGGFKEIVQLFQNDREMAMNMTNIYYNNLKSVLLNFSDNNIEGNLEQIKANAHKMIPSSRHMGFGDFADLLKKLEFSIENKIEKKKIKFLVDQVLTDSTSIIKIIESFLEVKQEKIHQ